MTPRPIPAGILISICVLSGIGAQLPIVLPILTGAIAHSEGLATSRIGLMISCAMAAFWCGTLSAPILLNRLDNRYSAAVLSCAAGGTFLALAKMMHSYIALLSMLFLNGLVAGALYALCFSMLASYSNPERNIGFKYAFGPLLGMGVVYLSANYIIPNRGVGAALAIIGCVVLGLAVFSVFLPATIEAHNPERVDEAARGRISRSFSLLLLSLGLVSFGCMGILSFPVPLAVAHRLTLADAGTAVTIGVVGGNLGALCASFVGKKGPHGFPYPAAIILAIMTLPLFRTPGYFLYAAAMFSFVFTITLATVFGMSALARAAPTAGLAALGISSQMAGNILGPLCAGVLFDWYGSAGLIASAVATLTLGLIASLVAVYSSSLARPALGDS
jgi:MFS family permease